jgi:hypothetical protein
MKSLIRLFVPIFVFVILASAQQKSDYATVKQFKGLIKSITQATNEAKTVQDCADITATIDQMEKDFKDDKALLDKALYPDDFTKTFELLRGRLMIRQKDLGVIETQLVRITELETQVRELSGQVSRLTGENDKLMEDIERIKGNIQKLSAEEIARTAMTDSLKGVINKLQKQLQSRDQLIFALVDSLFLQYDKNIADMKDVEKVGLAVKLERHSVFSNVKRSIEDNIKFLESTTLKGTDLIKIVQQQQRFQSQWKGLGPKLAAVYASGKKKAGEAAVVDTLLVKWGISADNAMWRSISQLFKEHGLVIKEFANGQEFYANLIAFVDDKIQNPTKDSDKIREMLFNNFDENIWKGELGTSWLQTLAETGRISDTQKKDIDAKVEQWRAEVSPGTSWLTYVLILLAVVLLIIVGYRYFQKKQK